MMKPGFRSSGKISRVILGEAGFLLIEGLVALALLGALAAAFLGGLATTSRANIITDERTTGESLARSQMEWIKDTDYVFGAATYTPPAPEDGDYETYTAAVSAVPLRNPDDGIQQIIITISRSGKEVFRLEGYKVFR